MAHSAIYEDLLNVTLDKIGQNTTPSIFVVTTHAGNWNRCQWQSVLREQDNFGIGYAYLDGSEQTLESLSITRIAEAYVNFGLHEYLSLTLDVQYMKYGYVTKDTNADGWISGYGQHVNFDPSSFIASHILTIEIE